MIIGEIHKESENVVKIGNSAPGRICLYGEHQDYLKLAVIPAAITMRTRIEAEINQSSKEAGSEPFIVEVDEGARRDA